jgi:O-methyltransferase
MRDPMRHALRSGLQVINHLLRPFKLTLSRTDNNMTNLYWRNVAKPEYKYSKISPTACYAPWLSDEVFMQTYDKVKRNTLVDIYRCFELWELAKQAINVPGDFLEVGVWRGGTASLIAKACQNSGKKVYLADTFLGVVKASSADGWYKGGEHADTTPRIVEELLGSVGLNNFKLLTGIFPDDTAHLIHGNLAFIHIDVDVYKSAKDIFDWAFPKLSPGGIVVVDDYGFDRCPGITKFCNELKTETSIIFFHNLNGHGIIVKR